MNVGALDVGVPTAKSDTKTVWTVPGISVLATTGFQVPVWALLEGLDAKHDSVLLAEIALAKAPADRSWRMCKPGPSPVNAVRVICTPVMESGPSNRKS